MSPNVGGSARQSSRYPSIVAGATLCHSLVYHMLIFLPKMKFFFTGLAMLIELPCRKPKTLLLPISLSTSPPPSSFAPCIMCHLLPRHTCPLSLDTFKSGGVRFWIWCVPIGCPLTIPVVLFTLYVPTPGIVACEAPPSRILRM